MSWHDVMYEYVLLYVVCIYRDRVLGDLSTSIFLWLMCYKHWFHEKERKQGNAYTNTQTH